MTTSSFPKNVIYGLYCTCHNAGIRYVGQTKRGASDRLKQHTAMVTYRERHGLRLSHSQNWMKKHGLENIDVTVLEVCDTEYDLDDAEERWVYTLENLTNIKPGGRQPRGYKMPEGHGVGEKNPMYGKDRSDLMSRIRGLRGPMSQENRRERAKRLEEFRNDPDWDQKRIEGIRRSHNTREYREEASKRVSGEKNPRYGKKLTPQERHKLSISLSPFTEDDIRDIRDRHENGERMKDIAADFGVDPSTISRIARRKRFDWIE